jgi:hypothetical protein
VTATAVSNSIEIEKNGLSERWTLAAIFLSERVADDKGRPTLVIVNGARSTCPDIHGAQDQSSGDE